MCPAILEDKTREYIDSLQGEAKDRDWTMQSGLYLVFELFHNW